MSEWTDLRDIDNQLLVSITNKLRLITEPLRPRLLHNGLSGAVRGLVEGGHFVKVDVLVQRELQCGGDVVRMVVLIAVMVMMTVVFVVAV